MYTTGPFNYGRPNNLLLRQPVQPLRTHSRISAPLECSKPVCFECLRCTLAAEEHFCTLYMFRKHQNRMIK